MAKGLVSEIKEQIKKSGTNKGKIVYFKDGQKVRIRFLEELDDGLKIPFHDSFQKGINVPCQELYGRDCKYCNDDELRHRDLYCWSVYDYEAKETKIILGAANNASPIPALVGMYDAYGTLMDRDYIITRSGTGTNTTYSVVPMDKVKFKNKKAKPFSESKILEILDKAFPDEDADEDDDHPAKKKKGKKLSGKRRVIEEMEEDDEDEDEETDEEMDYEEMSVKELYKLCQERDIKCKPKKSKDYYIDLLEEYDEENETFEEDGENDEDDEW